MLLCSQLVCVCVCVCVWCGCVCTGASHHAVLEAYIAILTKLKARQQVRTGVGVGVGAVFCFADLAAATTNGRQQLEAEQSDQYRFGGTADEFAYKSLTASHTRPDELVERYKILRQIKSMRKKVGAAHCPPARCCVCVLTGMHVRRTTPR